MPGQFTSLNIDVPTEYLTVYGKLPPKLKSITSDVEDGIYGTGDVIAITLEFMAEVNVSGIPTLTMNTGCHTDDCFVREIQSFTCAADGGSFAIRLEDQYIMSIDSNTTQDQLKYKLEELEGVTEVTVHYSFSESTNSMRNELCTSEGNTVTVTFEDFDFPQYDGDIPPLQLDRLNRYKDPRYMLSQGNVEARLNGVHNAYVVELTTSAVEVLKGQKQRDGLATYEKGSGSRFLTFHYVVRNGDLSDRFHVESLNFATGYIYSSHTGENISQAVPSFGTAFRYMDSSAGSLGSGNDISITSVNATVQYVTSPDANGVYTMGQVVTIHVVFDLPIMYFGTSIHLLLKPGKLFRKAMVHSLLSDKKTLVFKYEIAAGDSTSDLSYLSSSALVLDGGEIYRYSADKALAAVLTLPAVGSPNSLSGRKDIIIDTNSPLVLDFELFYPTSGNYTAGDEVDLLVRYDYAVSVMGSPVIWLKNTISPHNNARIRTAPLGQSVLYGVASPGDVSAITIEFQLNWDLQAGDILHLHLPHFGGTDNNDLYLHEGDTYADLFLASWNLTTETLDLTVDSGSIPASSLFALTVQSRSGVMVSNRGVVATTSSLTYSVSSQLFTIPPLPFLSVGAVMFSSLSLQVSPYTTGVEVVLQFNFALEKVLLPGDTLTLHMPGFTLVSFAPFSTAHSVFDMLWEGNSSTLVFNTTASVDDLLFDIRINDYLSFSSPLTGVGADTVTLDVMSELNGNVYGISIPAVSHVCSDPQASVVYDTKMPSSSSALSFSWTVGVDALNVGDSMVFTLPADGTTATGISRDITSFLSDSNADSPSWTASVKDRVVTFVAVSAVDASSKVNLIVAAGAGIVVPPNGVRPGTDTFSVLTVSSSCLMSTAKVTSFSSYVVKITNSFLTFSQSYVSEDTVGFTFNFTTSQSLSIGDVIFLWLPSFDRPGGADVFDSGVVSTTNVTARYNRLRRRMKFTLTASYVPVSGVPFSIQIPPSPGFYLPYEGIKEADGSVTMSIVSEPNGYAEGVIVSNACVGFCTVDSTFSSNVQSESLTATLTITFNQVLFPSEIIDLSFSGISGANGGNIKCRITYGTYTSGWTNVSAFPSIPVGTSIPAYGSFDLTFIDMQFTAATADITLSITNSTARRGGVVSVTETKTGIVFNPAITRAELDFDVTPESDLSQTVNMTFVFEANYQMAATTTVLLKLPDFDLNDFIVLSTVNDVNFTVVLDGVNNLLRITNNEDISAASEAGLTFAGVKLPYHGVEDVPSLTSTWPTYAVDFGDGILSQYSEMTQLTKIDVIRDATVQLTLDSITELHHFKVSFWINFDVTSYSKLDLVIPGLVGAGDVETVITNFPATARFFSDNSTMELYTTSTLAAGSIQFFVYANRSSLLLPSSGFSYATESTMVISRPNVLSVGTAVNLQCVGVCSALLSATVSKAGYATDYTFAVVLSAGISNGDVMALTLPGFSSVVGANSFALGCSSAFVSVQGLWSEATNLLTITFTTSAGAGTSLTSFTVLISRNVLLRLPTVGISSEANSFVMDWQSAAIGTIAEAEFRVKPVSTLTSASLTLTATRPSEVTNISIAFEISNPLTAGDVVIVTFPSYSVPSTVLQVSGASSAFFSLRGVGATVTSSVASLRFTVLQAIPADTLIALDVMEHIITPSEGVHAGSTRSTISVVSSTAAAMGSQTIAEDAPIGSLMKSAVSISGNRSSSGISVDVSFMVHCAPVAQDNITIVLPALSGSDHYVTVVYGNSTIRGFWERDSSSLVLTLGEDFPEGAVHISVNSSLWTLTSSIFYPNHPAFTFAVNSNLCPVAETSFDDTSAVGLKSSSLGFGNPVSGQVSDITFSITAVEELKVGDVISLNLTNFWCIQNTTILSATGVGVEYVGNISLQQFDGLVFIQFPVVRSVPRLLTLSFVLLSSNGIVVSRNGVDSLGTGMKLAVAHRSDDLLEIAGDILVVQSVGHFFAKSVEVVNRFPGERSALTFVFSLSDDILAAETVAFYLPGFSLVSGSNSLTILPVEGSFSDMFSAVWKPSSKVLTFTATGTIFGSTVVEMDIPDHYLLTPNDGIAAAEVEAYLVSSTASRAPVAPVAVDNISTIPSAAKAAITFAASDYEDASVVYSLEGAYNNSLLLYPGHDLTTDDIDATVTIDGELYTIKDVDGDRIEFYEVYAGNIIELGLPLTLLYTPDARPAYYLSGSETTELVFRYRVRKGDNSIGIHVHTSTSSSHITEPLALITSEDALLRYAPVPSVPLDRQLPSTVDSGKAINLDSTRPVVVEVSSTCAAGTYTAGDSIDIQIRFSHRVSVLSVVTNAPAVLLQKPSGEIAIARYIFGTGTNTLTFLYVVKEEDLVYTSRNLIRINDSTSTVVQPLRVIMANQFDYIRRYARYPTIDVEVDISPSAVNINHNISWIGDGVYVTEINAVPGERNDANVYTTGDVLYLYVSFSGPVYVSGDDSSPVADQVSILLEVGRASGDPGVARLDNTTGDNATLVFIYTITEEDSLAAGLSLYCTCADFFNRTFIQITPGTRILEYVRDIPASVLLAHDSSLSSLMIMSSFKIDTTRPAIKYLSANVSSSVHSPGVAIVISVHFDNRVSVIDFVRLVLSGDNNTQCAAHFFSGNNTDTLRFLYVPSVLSSTAAIACRFVDGLDTAVGKVFRYSQRPTVLADTTLPVPGSILSIGVKRKISVDGTAVYPLESTADVERNQVIVPLSAFHLRSTADEVLRAVYLYEQEDNPVRIEYNVTDNLLEHVQRFIDEPATLVNLFESSIYYSLLVSSSANSPLLYAPEVATTEDDLELFFDNDQWWSSYLATAVLELGVYYDRSVVANNVFVPLNVGNVLNNAVSVPESRTWHLYLDTTNLGADESDIAQHQYQVRYDGYTSKCIAVGGALQGVMSLHSKLNDIPVMKRLGLHVKRIQSDSDRKVFVISSKRPASGELTVAPSFAACAKPLRQDRVTIKGDGKLNLRYEIRSSNSIVLQPQISVPAGTYDIVIPASAGMSVSKFGVDKEALLVEHMNDIGVKISQRRSELVSIPHKSYSSLIFSPGSLPGEAMDVAVVICLGMKLYEGDEVMVLLPGFGSFDDNDLVGVISGYDISWAAASQALTFTLTSSLRAYECIDVSVSSDPSVGLYAPDAAILDRNQFLYSVVGVNGSVNSSLFDFVTETVVSRFAITISNPYPRNFSAVTIDFRTIVEIEAGSIITVFMPEYRLAHSKWIRNVAGEQIAPLSVVGPFSHAFTATWLNISAIELINTYKLRPYDYTLEVTEDSGIIVATPAQNQTLRPPSFALVGTNWSIAETPITNFTQVIGIVSSAVALTVDRAFDNSLTSFQFNATFSYDIAGPVNITIEVPSLRHALRSAIWVMDNVSSLEWSEFHKSFFYRTANTLYNETVFELYLSEENLTYFSVDSRGIAPQGHSEEDIKLSISAVRSYLPIIPVHNVKPIPMIKSASIVFDSDYFSSTTTSVAVRLDLNMPVGTNDTFRVYLSGAAAPSFNHNATLSGSSAAYTTSMSYNTGSSLLEFSLSTAPAGIADLEWIVPMEAGLYRPAAVTQYGINTFQVGWDNAIENTGLVYVDIFQPGPFLSSAIELDSPLANSTSDFTLKFITTVALNRDDKIVVALSGYSFKWSVISVSDSTGNLWTAEWVDQTLKLTATRDFPLSSFQFSFNNARAPVLPSLGADAPTISLSRGSSTLVPQSIKYMQPIGGIASNYSVVIHIHDYATSSVPVTDVSIDLAMNAALNIGDEIVIYIPQFTVLCDAEMEILAYQAEDAADSLLVKGMYEGKVDVDGNRIILKVLSVGITNVAATLRSTDGALQANWEACSKVDESCPITISVTSTSCPVSEFEAHADYILKFRNSGITLRSETYGIPGITFEPSLAPTKTAPPSLDIGTLPTSIPSGEPSGMPSSVPTIHPTAAGDALQKYVHIELNFTVQTLLREGTLIHVQIPQLDAATSLTSSVFSVVATGTEQALSTVFSPSWDDSENVLTLRVLQDTFSLAWGVTVISAQLSLLDVIIYDNDSSIWYNIEHKGRDLAKAYFDSVESIGLKSAILELSDVPAGEETFVTLRLVPSSGGFASGDTVTLSLPGFTCSVASPTYDLSSSSCGHVGSVAWDDTFKTLLITFSGDCKTLLHLTVPSSNGMQSSIHGLNAVVASPTLTLSKGGQSLGPSVVQTYQETLGLTLTKVVFNESAVSGLPTVVVVSFESVGEFETGDYVDIYLPKFWAVQYDIDAYDCDDMTNNSLTFVTEWLACSDTLRVRFVNESVSTFHCTAVTGLRLPRVGVSVHLADIITFSGQSGTGVIHPQVATYVQLVGHVLESSISFTNTSLQSDTGLLLTFTLDTVLRVGDDVEFHLPGFTAAGGVQVYTLDDPLVASAQFSVAWKSADSSVVLTVFHQIDVGESVSVYVGNSSIYNGFTIPAAGISVADTAEYYISTTSSDGNIIDCEVAHTQTVGFEVADVHYKVFDMAHPVEVTIHFRFSDALSVGDVIEVHAPSLEGDTVASLSVAGGQGVAYFESIATVGYDDNTKMLTLDITSEVLPFVDIDIHIGVENGLHIGSVGTLNQSHYISASTVSIGSLAARQILHSPSDIVGVFASEPSLACSLDGNYQERCRFEISVQITETLDAASSIVISHNHWLLDSRSSNYDALAIEGSGAAYFSAIWRPSDNSDEVQIAAEEITVRSDGYLYADEDYDYHTVERTVPSLRSNIAIHSILPRVDHVSVENSGASLVCGDSVTIAVKFTEAVSFKASTPKPLTLPDVRLLLNTIEYAYYVAGNATNTLQFIYHVSSPTDVNDLAPLGPNSLEFGKSTIHRLGSDRVAANLTIPPPYGRMRKNVIPHEIAVDCGGSVMVTDVNLCSKPVAPPPQFIQPGDTFDICVQFERNVILPSTAKLSLVLSGTTQLTDGEIVALTASYVNVSSEQWVYVNAREGSFALSHDGEVTVCVDWSDSAGLGSALNALTSLKDALPLYIETYARPEGVAYKLMFDGITPYVLRTVRYKCPLEPSVAIQLPDSALRTLTFRRQVLLNDSFEGNRLSVNNSDALIISSGAVYVATTTLFKTQADTTLPVSPASNSLDMQAASSIVYSDVAQILRVQSNFSSSALTGDVVDIEVIYPTPVHVSGYPFLEVEVFNVLKNKSVIRNAVYGMADNSGMGAHTIVFSYTVRHGDTAYPLVDVALQLNGSEILLGSRYPTKPVNISLPVLYNNRLNASNVIVTATAPPRLYKVTTNMDPGEYGEGQDIEVYLTFYAEVFIKNISVPEHAFILLNTTRNGRKMYYREGSGTNTLTFLYTVVRSDFTDALSFMQVDYSCLQLGGFNYSAHFLDSLNNVWEYIDECPVDSTLGLLSIDTSIPMVLRVNSDNEDGDYYPGQLIDVFVEFNKPVVILSTNNSIPYLELFIPHQIPNIMAEYAFGNGTTNIHFQYIIPPPPTRIFLHPNIRLDYAGTSSLFQHLRGTVFKRLSTRPTTIANVDLPTEDISHVRIQRNILLRFDLPAITSVQALNTSGTYTSGDFIAIEVVFTQPVMTMIPPVLRLNTGPIHKNAVYQSGNNSYSLIFGYTIEDGDFSERLDYVDTRKSPYNTKMAVSFALCTDVVRGASGRLLADVMGADGRHNDIVLYRDDMWGQVFRQSDVALVRAIMDLPIPGAPGSLSHTSTIIVDTSPPNITKIYTTIPDGSYGPSVAIPVLIRFNQDVVVDGEPRILFFVTEMDRFAQLVGGNGTKDLEFKYIINSVDNMPLFDYKHRHALEFPTHVNSSCYDVLGGFIKRKSQSPSVDSNLTLAWITYVESVIASTSITGSGHSIRLSGIAKALPKKISIRADDRVYAVGDVLEIVIEFTGAMSFLDNGIYIELNSNTHAYFSHQLDEYTAVFKLAVQSQDEVESLTYSDIFSLRTPLSCSIRDKSTGLCAAQNLPFPSTVRHNGKDELSPAGVKISQRNVVVSGIMLVKPSYGAAIPNKAVNLDEISGLCDGAGYSWYYRETIDESAGTRIITTTSCPNHFSACQRSDCVGVESQGNVRVRTVKLPLYPTLASYPVTTLCSTVPVAIALNGVDIVGPTDDSEECGDAVNAEGVSFDKCGGHADTYGNYHYHIPPVCLLTQLKDTDVAHSPQIGWALDGFPVYGPTGPAGVLMKPCSVQGADPIYCLDSCNGYLGATDVDEFKYRYYMSGPTATGECSTAVKYSGSCARSDDPCCVSAVPPSQFYPYSIGCWRGCRLGDADCTESGEGYNPGFAPSVSRSPTVVYDGTETTVQSFVTAVQAMQDASKSRPETFLPIDVPRETGLVEVKPGEDVTTANKIQVVITFTDAIVVRGVPLLVFFVDEETPTYLPFSGHFNATSLLFDYVVDGTLDGSNIWCTTMSHIDLNGGSILHKTNFLPIRNADLQLGTVCCENGCTIHVRVVDSTPRVSRVFSSQNGTFSTPDALELFVEFTGPVTVIGTPLLELKLAGSPLATFVGLENSRVLKFKYVIAPGDTTSALDYVSTDSFMFEDKGVYDGIFMDDVFEVVEANTKLRHPGANGSLGRSNTIVIDKTRVKNTAITVSPVASTAGDIITVSFQFNRDITVLDDSLLSLFIVVASPMYIRFNITSPVNNLPSERVAMYTSFAGNTLHFVYPVIPADPSGVVSISDVTPITLGDFRIVDEETGVLVGMNVDDSILDTQLGTIDNEVPYVVSVMSPNISGAYPWGIGDVIYLIVEMNSPVAVLVTPTLRLAVDNTDNTEHAYANFVVGTNASTFANGFVCYTHLLFVYTILPGDSASPLEYDGPSALEGDLRRCVESAPPSIPADLTLPDPFSLGSVGFCCTVNIDSSPPFVEYLMPLKKAGVYGLNELIVILVRFSKPVLVSGEPMLALFVGSSNASYAHYNESFRERDVLINVKNTDVLFFYTVQENDNTKDFRHFDRDALMLNGGSILHYTQSPVTEADITLRDPGDHELLLDKVQRQWKWGYPSKVEVIIRDFYHTDPAQLLVRIEHTSRSVQLFDSCCSNGGMFGRTVPGSRLGNNVTVLDTDTGIGSDLFFSDTRAPNIARLGVANQSSTEFGGVASRAIDGSSSPVYGDKSTTETSASDENGWWQLHLPAGSSVRSINIWPRTPQLWIPAMVSVTIKAYDAFPRGRFKLRLPGILDTNSQATTVVTSFINMGASAQEVQNKLTALGSLAQLRVFRETVTGDDVEKGHGWKYLITFNGVEIPEPQIQIINVTFVGGVDIIEDQEVENFLKFQLVAYSKIEKRGFAKPVNRVGNFVGGVDGLNSWLIPFWVMIFLEDGTKPPIDLNESIAKAVWMDRYDSIDKVKQIVLTKKFENVGYIKIQREGLGSLALAEVEVFEEKLNSLGWYTEGYPIIAAPVLRPYQPEDSFGNAFDNVKFTSRWSLQITSSPVFTAGNIRGWEGSMGTVSDWVLVVTDLAGVVHSYYQDLRAEVKSLPKYGSLIATTTESRQAYGAWKQAFELTENGPIEASSDMQRALGICNGVDTTGMNGVRSGASQYRYCTSNFGVGPPLNNRVSGDYPIQRFLRNERALYYIPRHNYRGPDFFTYVILDGPVVQREVEGESEVTVHVRKCRDSQDRRVAAGVHSLCSCAASEKAVVDDWMTCRSVLTALCDEAGYREDFLNLCVSCAGDLPDDLYLAPMQCVSEVIRAVSYLTAARRCDLEPSFVCSDEIYTEPGRENYNYLSLMSYPWNNPMSTSRDYTGDV